MLGDQVQLALCIESTHRYGIEVHVWKINRVLWNLNPDSLQNMKREKEFRSAMTVKGYR